MLTLINFVFQLIGTEDELQRVDDRIVSPIGFDVEYREDRVERALLHADDFYELLEILEGTDEGQGVY